MDFFADSVSDGDIGAYISRHSGDSRIKEAYESYLGTRGINKGPIPVGRPDNRANTNLAKYITDTATGYFMGVPPVYKFSATAAQRLLTEVFDRSDEQDADYRIAEDMSICGTGYDFVYIDGVGDVRIAALDPRNVFIIRRTDIDETPMAAVRYWRERNRTVGEIYYPHVTKQFAMKGGSVAITAEMETPFSAPNVQCYRNNRFCRGDFEAVMDNIDIYNLVLSGATDDLQSIANAYLVLSGMEKPDEETLSVLRTERVIGLPSDGGAAYITKNLNDSAIENHKKTLRQDIMQISGVPDLADECFAGNSSGVALRYKLWGIDQLFKKKAAFMEKGLFERMRRVAEALWATGAGDLGDVEKCVSIVFTRNMPLDMSENADTAVKLRDIVSRQTLFEMIEPVTGVGSAEEEERSCEEVLRSAAGA